MNGPTYGDTHVINTQTFESCVARAALAPTIHNTQPVRWTWDGEVASLFCDTNEGVPVCDPTGEGAALSCGAVLEGMVLALSAHGVGAKVTYTNANTSHGQGLVALAHVTPVEGVVDGLHDKLEQRFTWRSSFQDTPLNLYGWTRDDTRLIFADSDRHWIAAQNDFASHEIMQDRSFRSELVSWMRLSDEHPRAGLDGMDRASMHMTKSDARYLPLVLLRLWPFWARLGRTKGLVSEYEITSKTPLIALFHRDISESPVVSGRAYLRLCLEAASLGLAGWPMAALGDHEASNAALCERFNIGPDRRFIQAIRFGHPTGEAPPRARRPLSEVMR